MGGAWGVGAPVLGSDWVYSGPGHHKYMSEYLSAHQMYLQGLSRLHMNGPGLHA